MVKTDGGFCSDSTSNEMKEFIGSIINNILDSSRIEAGKLDLEYIGIEPKDTPQ